MNSMYFNNKDLLLERPVRAGSDRVSSFSAFATLAMVLCSLLNDATPTRLGRRVIKRVCCPNPPTHTYFVQHSFRVGGAAGNERRKKESFRLATRDSLGPATHAHSDRRLEAALPLNYYSCRSLPIVSTPYAIPLHDMRSLVEPTLSPPTTIIDLTIFKTSRLGTFAHVRRNKSSTKGVASVTTINTFVDKKT